MDTWSFRAGFSFVCGAAQYNITRIFTISVKDPGPFFKGTDLRFRIRIKMSRIQNKSAECFLLRAEGFSCSLDVLYGNLGKSK